MHTDSNQNLTKQLLHLHPHNKPKLKKDQSFMTDDELQKQQEKLIRSLKLKKHHRKTQGRVVVGGQAVFDINLFFKFQKKDELLGQSQQSTSLIDSISGGHIAWLVLAYAVFNNSMFIPWMISIGANKFLRHSWRHMFLNLIIIPFAMYERRKAFSTNPSKAAQQYKLSQILKPYNLKQAYLAACTKTFWLLMIPSAFQFVQISHALLLGNLMNFFLSINRNLNSSVHFLEPGGQIFVIIGIVMILKDQIYLDGEYYQSHSDSYMKTAFTEYSWQFRLAIDSMLLVVSIIMAVLYKYTTNLSKYYPSYLGMLIVNSMIVINMAFASYFFHGATFDSHPEYGIFGIFSDHFITFFTMSIFLGFGMLWSYAMISNLFPQTILPSLASLFEPIISLLILQFLQIQQLATGFTFVGFIFVIPGMFLILVGQNLYQKQKKNEEALEEAELKKVIELKHQRKLQKESQSQSQSRLVVESYHPQQNILPVIHNESMMYNSVNTSTHSIHSHQSQKTPNIIGTNRIIDSPQLTIQPQPQKHRLHQTYGSQEWIFVKHLIESEDEESQYEFQLEQPPVASMPNIQLQCKQESNKKSAQALTELMSPLLPTSRRKTIRKSEEDDISYKLRSYRESHVLDKKSYKIKKALDCHE